MTASIRAATPADRAAIVALLVAQFRDHGIGTPVEAIERTVDLLLMRSHRGRFVLAVEGDRAIGVAAVSFGFPVEHGGRGAWLEELYVEPAARGRGLGERLLAAALEAARADGAVAVDLEIEAGHERVESLYRRSGFTRLARTRWARPLAAPVTTEAVRPTRVTGGCLCGAVRYAIDGTPREISHCHCSLCRRAAGAPVVTWATYPVAAFRWTAGAPGTYHSTPPATRSFCSACGTALAFVSTDEAAWVDVTVASMDQAAAMAPHDHIWSDDRLPWLVLDDDLPRLRCGHGA